MSREGWEPIVAAMLADCRNNRAATLGTLGLLADLLAKDILPESGRMFLADRLKTIAEGGDLNVLVPQAKKQRAEHSAIAILATVERERVKSGAGRGDMEKLHARVAK